MDHDELSDHIWAVSHRQPAQLRGMTLQLVSTCWPGGSQDHANHAALSWLRRWHPDRLGTELPTCSCLTGRCGVCN
jgi:hypothetical protein